MYLANFTMSPLSDTGRWDNFHLSEKPRVKFNPVELSQLDHNPSMFMNTLSRIGCCPRNNGCAYVRKNGSPSASYGPTAMWYPTAQ